MSVTKNEVLEALRAVKGLRGQGSIVDEDLVSEVIIKEDRVYFSITVPIDRAGDLEPMRQAAEKAVAGVDGVGSVTAVLTAEAAEGTAGRTNGAARAANGGAPQMGELLVGRQQPICRDCRALNTSWRLRRARVASASQRRP